MDLKKNLPNSLGFSGSAPRHTAAVARLDTSNKFTKFNSNILFCIDITTLQTREIGCQGERQMCMFTRSRLEWLPMWNSQDFITLEAVYWIAVAPEFDVCYQQNIYYLQRYRYIFSRFIIIILFQHATLCSHPQGGLSENSYYSWCLGTDLRTQGYTLASRIRSSDFICTSIIMVTLSLFSGYFVIDKFSVLKLQVIFLLLMVY